MKGESVLMQWKRVWKVFPVAIGLLLTQAAQAQVTVTPTVTQNGSLFHYDYRIMNGVTDDLSIITLEGLPMQNDAVKNLMVPNGFVGSFDSGLGLLSFLEGTQAFSVNTTFSGFGFDSLFGPVDGTFSALDINGTEFRGNTLIAAAVPEPGTVSLLCGVVTGAVFALRRRRA